MFMYLFSVLINACTPKNVKQNATVPRIENSTKGDHSASHSVPALQILNTTTNVLYSDINQAFTNVGESQTLLIGEGEFRIDSMRAIRRKRDIHIIGVGAENTRIISSDMVNVVISVQHSQDIVLSHMLLTHKME